jgi:hypothetical protein
MDEIAGTIEHPDTGKMMKIPPAHVVTARDWRFVGVAAVLCWFTLVGAYVMVTSIASWLWDNVFWYWWHIACVWGGEF